MHPAFSVFLLTTLLGVGQGLFLALYTGESYSVVQLLPAQAGGFYAKGSAMALLFLIGGLGASFFHLGHPERAWRAASQWRTSWLSREIVMLPLAMGWIALYGLLHLLGWDLTMIGVHTGIRGDLTLIVGAIGAAVTFGLFVCTAMIYTGIKFLQEWATPLTVFNYTLLGGASGFALATAFSAFQAPDLTNFYGGWAILITLAAMVTRVWSLIRNARIKRKSTLQTAIGIRHSYITQRSQGFMGGSFNTREFFHGARPSLLRSVRWLFLVLVFPVPILLLGLGMGTGISNLLVLAFVVQYAGLMAERWCFFAQANHPQNLYYQTIG